MYNQNQNISQTGENMSNSDPSRLTQILEIIHRHGITWDEAEERLGFRFDDTEPSWETETTYVGDEYDEELEDIKIFFLDEEDVTVPTYPEPDLSRFKTFMAAKQSPPEPTFILKSPTEIWIDFTTMFVDGWQHVSDSVRSTFVGTPMPLAGALMGSAGEESRNFICGFTKSFERVNAEELSEIDCKVFEESANGETCQIEFTLKVAGRDEFDLNGVKVVLQIAEEEYEAYSDPLGEVVFDDVKKNRLEQGEISFRIVNPDQ